MEIKVVFDAIDSNKNIFLSVHVKITLLYRESDSKLWIFLHSSIRDTSQKKVPLKFKSTTFPLGQSTIYSSELINFDLQLYNFITIINVDYTGKHGINLQSTFVVPPPCGI